MQTAGKDVEIKDVRERILDEAKLARMASKRALQDFKDRDYNSDDELLQNMYPKYE